MRRSPSRYRKSYLEIFGWPMTSTAIFYWCLLQVQKIVACFGFLLSVGCADKCYMFFRSFRFDFWVFWFEFGILDFSLAKYIFNLIGNYGNCFHNLCGIYVCILYLVTVWVAETFGLTLITLLLFSGTATAVASC